MSKTKVIALMGSPRKNGNCDILTGRVADGIKSMGGEVEICRLHQMNIKPCDGCDICRDDIGTDCIIDDDMQKLYPKLREADALVIASPIYYFSVTAQVKLFMDRCHSLGGPQGYALKGKRIGIVLTYGDPDPFVSGAGNAIGTLRDTYNYIGAEIVGIVHGVAMDPGDISSNSTVMNDAFKLGEKLVSRVD